jgi:hypothetical protein
VYLLGPGLLGFRTIAVDPTFGSLTSFKLDERVSLVKNVYIVFIETDCFGVQSVDTVGRCTTLSYLLAGPVCL